MTMLLVTHLDNDMRFEIFTLYEVNNYFGDI